MTNLPEHDKEAILLAALKEIMAFGNTGRSVIDPFTGEKTGTIKLSAAGQLKCRMIARAAVAKVKGKP
jgi:hypothetical protein